MSAQHYLSLGKWKWQRAIPSYLSEWLLSKGQQQQQKQALGSYGEKKTLIHLWKETLVYLW